MPVPTSYLLPNRKNIKDKKDVDIYITDLVFELERIYEILARGVNGDIKSSYQVGNEKWTPTLHGFTTDGTFTYTRQTGWVFRQGLMVDVWADIVWTNPGAATGWLYLELPYLVTNSDHIPFVGECFTSDINLGAGYTSVTSNAEPNSYRCQFIKYGSAISAQDLTVPASGRLAVHVRYIGVQDE